MNTEIDIHDCPTHPDKLPAYRIAVMQAAPKLAKGHNPNKLTEEQVGVANGWRLLEVDELKSPQEKGTQYWSNMLLGVWSPIAGRCATHSHSETYRTQRPVGYFLPKTQEQKDREAYSDWVKRGVGPKCTFFDAWDAALQYERSRQ